MPIGALRPCTHPLCHALVSGRGRCPAHQTQRYAEDRAHRGSAHERGYDHRWRRYREQYLRAHPLCVLCTAEGRVEAATVVDHITPAKLAPERFYDPTNHRPLCKPHHDAIVDQGDFGRRA